MKERPILFSGEMVRAILEGRKTQTRRVLKKQPLDILPMKIPNEWVTLETKNPNRGQVIKCRFGVPGDLLWVRESLRRFRRLEFLEEKNYNNIPYYMKEPDYSEEDSVEKENQKWTAQYMATNTAVPYKPGAKEGWCGRALWQWKNTACPSIHMPRWACRITLKITNVRVERLRDISEDDAKVEGWGGYLNSNVGDGFAGNGPKTWFVKIWDNINAKRGYPWDINPWVWVIEFEKLEA